MLSSVNISSVWLLTERWICSYSVWGRVLEKRQGFAGVCLTQVGHLLQGQGGHHLPPLVSFHFTSLPSWCQEKLPFVSQVWQAEWGKWYRERFGSFFSHQLAGDTRYPTVGEGCPKCPGDWREGKKTPKSLFFFLWWVLFLCVVNLLVHQKGWRPRKGKQHARLKNFMCRKKGISFSPCDLPLISDLQKGCYLVWYGNSPAMMCYMVCMCVQAVLHPSQTHISSAKNTKGKKPFYHFSFVVRVCGVAV